MVRILSRLDFEVICHNNGFCDTNIPDNLFFICIHNTSGANSEPFFKENHDNVLSLWFDDCTEDRTIKLLSGEIISEKAMTHEQAKQIHDFLTQQENSGRKNGIIHCMAGIARSGAVGTFAATFFNVDMEQFKRLNTQIQPNPHVLALLNKILWEKHFNNE